MDHEKWLIDHINLALIRELKKQDGEGDWAIAGFEEILHEFVPAALNAWDQLYDESVFADDISCGSITEKYADHLRTCYRQDFINAIKSVIKEEHPDQDYRHILFFMLGMLQEAWFESLRQGRMKAQAS